MSTLSNTDNSNDVSHLRKSHLEDEISNPNTDRVVNLWPQILQYALSWGLKQ